MSEWLYGKNPVKEVLVAGRRQIQGIFFSESAKHDESLQQIHSIAEAKGVSIKVVPKEFLANRVELGPIQGVVAEVGPFPLTPFKEWLGKLEALKQGVILALDQVQDPQNLGAILRVSEGGGGQGVLIPEKHSCPITPAVSKASSGALEHQQVCKVSNLVQALRQLQEKGFWLVGTEAGAGENVLDFAWPEKTVLVLGAEGPGMRRLTREVCDFLINIPLLGRISSLNVAQAAAVCLYLRLKEISEKGSV
jgi:23S rRNA (guanosine2251-2'-O)-methyltransferase